MFPFSWLTIPPSEKNANKKSDVRCPLCGECCRICRNGHYRRYRFEGNDQFSVQRYCCRNPDCPRKTFSILPKPWLPYCRIPLCLLMALYRHHILEGKSINDCARKIRRSRHTAKRAVTLARRLICWFRKESVADILPPAPCGPWLWPAFIRAYSYAFFPNTG